MNRTVRRASLLVPLVLLACQGDPLEWQMPDIPERGWWGGFASQGTDDHVLALGVHDSLLVAGGYFQHAGPVPAACVAAWDGRAWQALGTGLRRDGCPGSRCDASVACFTSFEGALIAGGRFTEAGGVRAANVARWDGSSWSALGEGLDGTVLALAVHAGQLVAGGDFTRSGTDSTVRHVAAWDGMRWQALGGGTNGCVRALATTSEGLVAGGDFTMAGADSAWYVAQWSDSQWSSLPRLFGPVYGILEITSGDEPQLHVCGRQLRDSDTNYGLLVRWGRMWNSYHPGSMPANPNVLADFAGTLIVGGDSNYGSDSRTNGVGRLMVSSSNALRMGGGVWGQVFALCVYQGSLYVGGRFEQAGSVVSPHIARWDD